jgi:OmpA family
VRAPTYAGCFRTSKEEIGVRKWLIVVRKRALDSHAWRRTPHYRLRRRRGNARPSHAENDRSLDRLADYLQAHPQTHILIEGHTDSRGSEDYNEALSARRAQAVAAALISRGVSPEAVQTRGLGKSYPVATNDTAAGRQQNRRVEIVFSDAAGRFAEGDANASSRR